MMMIRSSSFNNSSISVCWLLSAFFLSLLLLNTRNTIAFSYHPITKTTTTLLRRSNNNRQQQWKNQQLLSSPSQRTELQYSSYNSNNQIRSRPLSINTVTQGRKMKSTTISTALLLSSKMAATASSSSVEGDYDPNEIKSGWVRKLRSIYQFTRPHTIRGTILASIAGTTRVILDIGPKSVFTNLPWISIIPKAFIGVIALLLGNAFIVGINQIYDKDIDIMNKPYLPIASGEMSKQYAWILTILSVIIGPILVYTNFPILLFQLYSIGILLGYLYSVPPFRTKRNPIAAALTIACVRGLFLNFGVYYAVLNALRPNIPFIWSPKVAFISRFMTLYAVIIAITKDLPDVEGDKVRTFLCTLLCMKINSCVILFLLGNLFILLFVLDERFYF